MNKKIVINLIPCFILFQANAENLNIHISEGGVMKKEESQPSLKPIDSQPVNVERYVISEANNANPKKLASLDPKKKSDANELGKSIEFEMYRASEDHNSYTVFEAGSGICNGFSSKNGVKVTDSSVYYVKKNSKDEYYANIAGATVNAKTEPKDVRYAPIVNVHNQEVANQIRQDESKYGKRIAENNLNKRSQFLEKIVCQQEGKE